MSIPAAAAYGLYSTMAPYIAASALPAFAGGMYRQYRRRRYRRQGKVLRVKRGRSSRRQGKRGRKRRRQTLPRRLKKLEQRVEAGMGTYSWRRRTSGRLLCNVAEQAYKAENASQISVVEQAIDNLPVFNPAIPGTYTFVDFTSGTQQKEVEIANTYTSLKLTNNYQVPVKCTVYLCKPKADTSFDPNTTVINGLADIGSGLSTVTPMIAPGDSHLFKDLWKVHRTFKKVLTPGQNMYCSNSVGSFQYDPSVTDSHALAYQNRYGGHSYLIRIEGVLGHDTSADEQANLSCGVDFVKEQRMLIKYEAGADIHYIEVADEMDQSFTNAGVVSQKPVADNQSYSVS